MRGLSAGKLRTIIALNFAAIALLVGLLFYNPWKSHEVSVPPQPYERIRTAEISLHPALGWELELLGGGKDTAVASFVRDGFLYIFGNTTSEDLDFDRAGVFLSIIDVYGVTKGVFIFGKDGDVLRSVCLCEGGFLLAIESDTPMLMLIDFSGEVKQIIQGFLHSFEEVVMVKYYNYGYLLFTQPKNALTEVSALRCTFFSPSLIFLSSNIAASPYSLNYFESVVISDKVVVFCNASSSMHTLPAAVEFLQNSSPKIHVFDQFAGEIKGFSVYDGEFLLLTNMEGSSLLLISLSFEVKERVFLSQLSALGLSKMPDSYSLYLVFLDTVVYVITGKGERKASLPAFVPMDKAYVGESVVYGGEGVCINVYSGGRALFGVNLYTGENPIIALDNNNLFCVFHKDDNVQVVKLRYPLFL